MTVFTGTGDALTMDFRTNDVGFVPVRAGHYIENTGAENCAFLELFPAREFQEMSMNMWLHAVPRQVAMAHTNLPEAEINTIPDKAVLIL